MTRAPPAGGTGAPLTPGERRALHIVSVGVAAQDPSGLVVTVTFRGNLQQAIGRGHLKNAAVVMILKPKMAGSAAAAAVLTQGPGAIGQTLRKTRSTDVGVVRTGRIFEFFIHGPGASQVGQVLVKSFATKPTAKGRSFADAGAPGTISAAGLDALDRAVANDQAAFDLAHQLLLKTSCDELKSLRTLVTNTKTNTLRTSKELGNLETALEKQIASLREHPISNTAIAKVWNAISTRLKFFLEVASAPVDGTGLLRALERYLDAVKTVKQRADVLVAAETAFESEIEDLKTTCYNNFALRAGYDHTTPGNPPTEFPSTVCADFGPETFFHKGDDWSAYLLDESGHVLKKIDGTFESDYGTGRVVFGIPKPGTYFIKVDVPVGLDQAQVRIPVPTPPPSDKSKDCSAPPPPA